MPRHGHGSSQMGMVTGCSKPRHAMSTRGKAMETEPSQEWLLRLERGRGRTPFHPKLDRTNGLNVNVLKAPGLFATNG